MAELFDLTGTLADTQEINNAWFYNVNAASTGSGVIESFVRIQTNAAVEQGYNTDARPLQYDERGMSIGVLFNDNSYLLIGMNVGDFTDSGIVDLSYIKNRLYSDLQKYPRC